MAEILRLDPFQMVRSWVAPEAQAERQVVPRAFQISRLTPPNPESTFSVTRTLCAGGTKTVFEATHWEFGVPEGWFLFGDIYNCQQMDMIFVGEQSGVRHSVRGLDREFLGYPSCVTTSCYIPYDEGMVRHRAVLDGTISSGNWTEWSTVDPGFILNEWVDIEIPFPPRFQIVSITEDPLSGFRVETTQPHNFADSMQVRIEGTQNYDQVWEIFQIISPTVFRVRGRYVADETVGEVFVHYVPFIF